MSSFFKDFRPTYHGEFIHNDELKSIKITWFCKGWLGASTVVACACALSFYLSGNL